MGASNHPTARWLIVGSVLAAGAITGACDQDEDLPKSASAEPTATEAPSAASSASAATATAAATATTMAPLADPATVAKLTQIAQTFVADLRAGRTAKARTQLAKVMLDAMSEAQLGELWPSLVKKVGAFERVERTSHEVKGKFDVVRVTCKFAGATLDVKVVFDQEAKISGLWIVPPEPDKPYEPPAYVKADSFADQELEVGQDPWKLPASLSLPKAAGTDPVAALVLVHGSGPQDRDESIGPNKPFRDLAWGLASRGIAVLRYEKRTKQHGAKMSKQMLAELTLDQETVEDALAAVKLLRNQARVDAKRIFVLGHSLGGTAVPRIARADKDIRGFVIAAGSTRRFEELVLAQMQYILGADGQLSADDKAKLAELEKKVKRARALKPGEQVASSDLPLGVSATYLLDLNRPPAELIRDETRPLLFLQGERDYQVTVEDFRGWQEPLANKTNATFKSYAELNHLFMAGEGKSTPAEYEQVGHVAARVITDIAEWMAKQQ